MKILGLDLGSTSIGWALIEEDSDPSKNKILALGSRIIPLNSDESDEFAKGNSISKNQKRTLKRSLRRGYYRYDQRRQTLKKILSIHGMLPGQDLLLKITRNELYGLRDAALKNKISLQELGRIFLHLNQRRGYKSSKKDENKDGKITEYEQKINARFLLIEQIQITIGQYFYSKLTSDPHFRVKEEVFPRKAYEDEFEKIWNTQSIYYPNLLTPDLKKTIKDQIIYYQRNLKSQKGLVSYCELEGAYYPGGDKKEVFAGPKVAPQSSPIAQVCKVWESINNISINNRRGEQHAIPLEKKNEIFLYLDTHERLSEAELFKILGIKKTDGYFSNALISKKGISGNTTKIAILNILTEETYAGSLEFKLSNEEYEKIDLLTGELISRIKINKDFENEPLYKLWHAIYSTPDELKLVEILIKKFRLPEDKAQSLAQLDFTKGGFTKKSARAIRKILPYLSKGLKFSDACLMAGYNHSNSITTEENLKRELLEEIPRLKKNSLRQPVVEKILNQMINLVNAIIKQYGRPDEIRIELARELKQSKEERNEMYKKMSETERYHDQIRKYLLEHPEFQKKKVTRRDIERYKLWEEFDRVSPYEPSKVISIGELYSGMYDIEHIIPKAKLFDDSFSNKTICPRHLNSGTLAKNKLTAIEFMKSRSDSALEEYLRCIQTNKNITRAKREKLLMLAEDIPDDFIARQLRETQYVTRKAKQILMQVCHHVYATSGTVTQKLRGLWGWDDAIVNLQLPKYRALGKTVWEEIGNNGTTIRLERIAGWNKRDDNRHHAIDALVIACTRNGFIQRMNTLNADHTRDEIFAEVKDTNYNHKLSLLENYLILKKPFTTNEVQHSAASILISFKNGKRVATHVNRIVKRKGKKIIAQSRILVPRGPLSEESTYGKIEKLSYKEVKLGPSFDGVDKIADSKIKQKINERLTAFSGNPANAFKNLEKNSIRTDDGKEITKITITEKRPEYVIKYPVQNISTKDIASIVDERVKTIIAQRLSDYNNNPKEAYKNLNENPIWLNKEKGIQIKSVRCYTGLNVVAPIRVEDKIQNIIYEKYVKPGNNHHIAIYLDKNGKRQEHVVTFWDAVERKKFGLPVVITNPKIVWDLILQKNIDSQELLLKLPPDEWKYETSMQQNEMFVFNIEKKLLDQIIAKKDYSLISENLFRVRKITSGSYWFNHHCETTPRESLEDKKMGRCIQASLKSMTGIKVRINNLGILEKVGL